jgi:hypothetical protein
VKSTDTKSEFVAFLDPARQAQFLISIEDTQAIACRCSGNTEKDMSKVIEITKTARGAAISFPFEYKDAFKKRFPSAKWNAEEKVWTVGANSGERLEQFADAMQQNLDMRLEREEREMTAEELHKLRDSLEKVEGEIVSTRKAVDDL